MDGADMDGADVGDGLLAPAPAPEPLVFSVDVDNDGDIDGQLIIDSGAALRCMGCNPFKPGRK